MINNANAVSPFWAQLEGSTIDGIYPMLKLITASNTAALYETKLPRDETPYILIAIANASEERLQIWERVRMFNHPGILRIVRSGRTEVDGVPVTYAIEEKPDEYLSSVFAERALSGDETRQVLTKVLDALDFIHTQALVHSCIQPHHIMAVNDAIKISGECLQIPGSLTFQHDDGGPYRAPEVPVDGYTAPADIWSLGATLFQALTQRGPAEVTESRVAELPEPFPDIVAGCLQADPGLRWNDRQIKLALKGERAAPARAAAAAAGAGGRGYAATLDSPEEPQQYNSVGEPIGNRSSREAWPTPADQLGDPVLAEGAGHRSRSGSISGFDPDHHHPRRLSPLAVVMSVGAALIVAGAWYGRVHNNHRVPLATTPGPRAVVAAPSNGDRVSDKGRVTRTLPATPTPQVTAPVTAPPARLATAHEPSHAAPGLRNWRVIAFTYNRAQDAEKKAQSLNRQARGPRASVFFPKPGHGPYLVSVGGQMTREQAQKLRSTISRFGFPRGSYAQNFQR